MPYFQHRAGNEKDYTRQFPAASGQAGSYDPAYDGDYSEEYDEEYDDGFDELEEDYIDEEGLDEEIPEEELQAEKRRKYRIAANIGDLGATLIGTGVILALLAFLISMIRFVSSDFVNNFSLWQTGF